MPSCCQGPVLDTPGPSVSVGVEASGQAVVVGGSGSRLCEKRFIPGSGWQGTMVLATPGPDATAPQLAVNPNGQALLAWTNFGGDGLVKARAYQPGSGWAQSSSVPPPAPGVWVWASVRRGTEPSCIARDQRPSPRSCIPAARSPPQRGRVGRLGHPLLPAGWVRSE